MNPIPYGRHFIDDGDISAVVEALKSDFLTQGSRVNEFEETVAAYHNCKYAVAFSSGTAALHGAYYASGMSAGDEFITSNNTFVASANAGLYVGGTPVLCDITMEDYNIDQVQAWEKVTPKTKVITPVSYAGNPADLKELYEKAAERRIVIIHDAAHAIGAKCNGHNICDFAHMTMLSFHPVKHVTTGEGGMILTNDEKYYKKLILFRSHGITKNSDDMENRLENSPWYYEMQELGYNYRLTDLQCALGISQMKKLDASIKRRNIIADTYAGELSGVQWLTTPGENKNKRHSYHLYPVLVDKKTDRGKFFNYLRAENIFVQVHYIPVSYMPYYQKNFGCKKGDFPVCEDFYDREISLPMFPTITETEQQYVIDKIKAFGG